MVNAIQKHARHDLGVTLSLPCMFYQSWFTKQSLRAMVYRSRSQPYLCALGPCLPIDEFLLCWGCCKGISAVQNIWFVLASRALTPFPSRRVYSPKRMHRVGTKENKKQLLFPTKGEANKNGVAIRRFISWPALFASMM